MTLKFNTEF